jgi:hypothetical protein
MAPTQKQVQSWQPENAMMGRLFLWASIPPVIFLRLAPEWGFIAGSRGEGQEDGKKKMKMGEGKCGEE